MMTLETNPPRHDRRDTHRGPVTSPNLLPLASEPPRGLGGAGSGRGDLHGSGRAPSPVSYPNGLRCTRVAAHTVSRSAAWHRRLSRQTGVSPRFEQPIGPEPGRVPDRPEGPSD